MPKKEGLKTRGIRTKVSGESQLTERLSDGPMDGPTETDGQTNGRIEGWTEYLTDMPGRL